MNIICESCDAKNRLKLCNGKDGSFKYCYRRSGNPEITKSSIFQFNTIEELKSNLIVSDGCLNTDSMEIDWGYGRDNHTALILCKYKDNTWGIIKDHLYPEGWIYY